jgi:hypothetical protein
MRTVSITSPSSSDQVLAVPSGLVGLDRGPMREGFASSARSSRERSVITRTTSHCGVDPEQMAARATLDAELGEPRLEP